MSIKNDDKIIKILLLGDSGSGKTAVLNRYCFGAFRSSVCTIGIDFKIKNLVINNDKIRLQLWDTAGQERFRTIARSYYRGAQAVIIMYDITDRKTFEDINYWICDIMVKSGNDFLKVLVGNKVDLDDKRIITFEEGKQLADKHNINFFETSAKTGQNIEELFNHLSKQVYDIIKKEKIIKVDNMVKLQVNKCC